MSKKINTLLLICNLILIAVIVLIISTSSQQEKFESPSPETNVVEFGGVLRPNEKGGWTILNDTDHMDIGLSHIEQEEKSIKLFFEDSYKLEKVNWVSVTVDETLAAEEVFVGASVGLDHMVIQMVKDGELVAPSEFDAPNSNLWVYVRGERKL